VTVQADKISQTATGTAIGRALENLRPERDRLFDDALAFDFLPRLHRAIVRLLGTPWIGAWLLAMRERQVPGIMGNLVCRTRFIDDQYRAAVAGGVGQIVILGAGLDSRAFRLPSRPETQVFELDHPATQAWKRNRLDRLTLGPQLPPKLVPIDFNRQDLGTTLIEGGYQTDSRTLFIWEGVTQYIQEEAVDATLRFVATSSPPGSRLVFTYVDRALINGSRGGEKIQRLLAQLQRQGEPWVFGIHPTEVPGFLTARGLVLVEDVGAADYRHRYLEPIGRTMNLFDGERVAAAEVPEAPSLAGSS
jgi:methyltransferase (TIGR00027 family)